MDKIWMHATKFSNEYVRGVESFMKFVDEHIVQESDIKCPCKHCLNSYTRSHKEMTDHLYFRGIDTAYTRWIYHVECSNYRFPASTCDNDNVNEDDDQINGVKGLLANLEDFYDNTEYEYKKVKMYQ